MNGWIPISNYGNGFNVVSNGKKILLQNKVSGNMVPFPGDCAKEKEILTKVMKNNFREVKKDKAN